MFTNNQITHSLPYAKKLGLLLIIMIGFSANLNAQTVTAPNQCLATPTFSQGTVSLACAGSLVTAPFYVEDFDDGFGDFSEDPQPSGANDLTVSTNGDTPSFGTGPETTASCNDSTNDGEFIFLEGSFTLPSETHCMTNNLDLSSVTGPLALSFWYHMFGDNIGTLTVNVDGDAAEFTISGQQQTANGQPWQQATFDLSDKAGNAVVELEVCMTEGNGSVSEFKSDISVDQFEVYSCQPDPSSSCFVVTTENGNLASFCL